MTIPKTIWTARVPADQAQEAVGDHRDDEDVDGVAPREREVGERSDAAGQSARSRGRGSDGVSVARGRGSAVATDRPGHPQEAHRLARRRERARGPLRRPRPRRRRRASRADVSAAGAPSATPEKRRTNPLREAPTATGNPSDRNAARWRRRVEVALRRSCRNRGPGRRRSPRGETPAVDGPPGRRGELARRRRRAGARRRRPAASSEDRRPSCA